MKISHRHGERHGKEGCVLLFLLKWPHKGVNSIRNSEKHGWSLLYTTTVVHDKAWFYVASGKQSAFYRFKYQCTLIKQSKSHYSEIKQFYYYKELPYFSPFFRSQKVLVLVVILQQSNSCSSTLRLEISKQMF